MARRNERTLYKRACDFCHSDVISMYPRGSKFKVYCNACWWSDKWDPLEYGREYDFSKSFFEQFYELSLAVPRVALYQKNPVNSPYTNHTDHPKDCYLCVDSGFSENGLYCKWIINCRDVMDCYGVLESELCYELNECDKCSRSKFLFLCAECLDCAFLYDCRGCNHCFMSSNLRNKSFMFENKQLSKEEYEKRIGAIKTGNSQVLARLREQFENEVLKKSIRKYATFNKIVNSTGDYLFECKNVRHSFHVYESENAAYSTDAANLKDCYDAYEPAFNCEQQYECHAGNRLSYSKFSSISYDNHHLEYCEMCHGSSDLFGSVALRDKHCCVFNKQYSKEEYEILVQKIKGQMAQVPFRDKEGRQYRYGEFFPIEHSPFAYDETVAQEYFPLDKGNALRLGFAWREREERNYTATKRASDVKGLDNSLLNEIFECAHGGKCREQCTAAFRITPEELVLYRRFEVTIPALCPNCRHYARIRQRNPLKLWHRSCQRPGGSALHFHGNQKCPNEFETSYAPDRPEIVYCEQCYNAEVA